jgi:cell division protein FtsN
MRDYKETVPRGAPRGVPKGQKSGQLKRLFGIMGGMVFTFAIFVAGVKVGIQMERERVRIAQGVTAPIVVGKEKEDTNKSEKDRTTPPPAAIDEKMHFTFYDTLTKKEGKGKETQAKETQAKTEQKVTEKKGETKASPLQTTKVKESKEATAQKESYFVQIASFQEEETAEGLRTRLTKKGYPVQVVPVQIDKMGLWYRVRLGAYTTLQEAQTAQKRISVEEHIEETKVISGP